MLRILEVFHGERFVFQPADPLVDDHELSESNASICPQSRRGATSGVRFKGQVINHFDPGLVRFGVGGYEVNYTNTSSFSNSSIESILRKASLCDKWGVVTTIFEPSEAIVKMTSMPGWCTVVGNFDILSSYIFRFML